MRLHLLLSTFILALSFILGSQPVYAADTCNAIFATQSNTFYGNESLSDPQKIISIESELGRKLSYLETTAVLRALHLKENDYEKKYQITKFIFSREMYDRLFNSGILRSPQYTERRTEILKKKKLAKELGLDDYELNLIFRYTSELYYVINRSTKYEHLSQNLLLALAKLPAFKGTVYRSLKSKYTTNISVGQTIEAEAFWSTSKDRAFADTWIDGGSILVIETSVGRELSLFSRYPRESEVLIPVGSRFKVQRIEGPLIYISDISN